MNNSQRDERFHFQDVFGKETNCDRTNTLYEYFEGVLPQNEQSDFQKHLLDCDPCAKLLAELHEASAAAQNTLLDAHQADRIFSENRAKIQKRLTEKYPAVILPKSWNFRIPVYANAMLIVVIGLLVYPAYRSFVLNQEVVQLNDQLNDLKSQKKPPANTQPANVEPVISPSLLYSARIERDTSAKTIRIDFKKSLTFTLLFSLPPEDFQNYSVEIIRENQNIWQNQISAVGEDSSQLISIQLQKEYFQQGKYDLKIYGNREQTKTLLSQFELTIVK
jgi:hypothetical protein